MCALYLLIYHVHFVVSAQTDLKVPRIQELSGDSMAKRSITTCHENQPNIFLDTSGINTDTYSSAPNFADIVGMEGLCLKCGASPGPNARRALCRLCLDGLSQISDLRICSTKVNLG